VAELGRPLVEKVRTDKTMMQQRSGILVAIEVAVNDDYAL
jgi:hypothetical protein